MASPFNLPPVNFDPTLLATTGAPPPSPWGVTFDAPPAPPMLPSSPAAGAVPLAPAIQPSAPMQPQGGGGFHLDPSQWTALIGLAASLIGGRRTTGLAQGLVQGQGQQQEQAQQQALIQQRQDQIDAENEARQVAAEQRAQQISIARQKALQDTLMDVAKTVPSFKNAEDANAFLDTTESILRGAGYQLPQGGLRKAYPWRAPDAKTVVGSALDKLLKVSPDALNTPGGMLQVDTNGDGVPENLPIKDALNLAGWAVVTDSEGNAVPIKGGGGSSSEFQTRLNAARKDFAETNHRQPTAKEDAALIERIARPQATTPDAAYWQALRDGDQAAAQQALAAIRTIAATKPRGAPADLTPNAKLTATRGLRNDYVKETASARAVAMQLELMKSSLAAVKSGAVAAGSQGVLVTFQKVLDPTSVVRESEYARSASGQSTLAQLEGQWFKIQQGGAGVPIRELEKFVQLAEQFSANQQRSADETKNQINAIAREYGIDPSLVTGNEGVDVTLSDGSTAHFATQAQADAFKRARGIR